MAKQIDYTIYLEQGQKLMDYIGSHRVPYVAGGMTLDGMDCQGLCEYLLVESGFSKSEINLSGCNAQWRDAVVWRGTVEEAVKLFGGVPKSSWMGIWEQDGQPSHYKKTDLKKFGKDMGNMSHIGAYLQNGYGLAASSKRESVITSPLGKKSINGGWNRVMLCKWIKYSDRVMELAQGAKGWCGEAVKSAVSPSPTASAIAELNPGTPTIRKGSKGVYVTKCQQALVDQGYDIGSYGVDGDFGRSTQAAVMAFQRAKGLSDDGIVGPLTWAALGVV